MAPYGGRSSAVTLNKLGSSGSCDGEPATAADNRRRPGAGAAGRAATAVRVTCELLDLCSGRSAHGSDLTLRQSSLSGHCQHHLGLAPCIVGFKPQATAVNNGFTLLLEGTTL